MCVSPPTCIRKSADPVKVFDEGEGHWHIHLEGAKNMFQKMCSAGGRPSDFLVTWFLYHAVMGCFTKPFHEDCGSLDILGLFECLNLEKTTVGTS